jgi:hypothetical protein
MSEVIKLVADAILKTKEAYIKSAEIYMILNMVTEKND